MDSKRSQNYQCIAHFNLKSSEPNEAFKWECEKKSKISQIRYASCALLPDLSLVLVDSPVFFFFIRTVSEIAINMVFRFQ